MVANLIDAPEVASRFKVPLSFIYARTRRNAVERIPHIKLGKYLRFDPERLAEWIAAHERGNAREVVELSQDNKSEQARTTPQGSTKRRLKSRGAK